ncbi:response regulator transcription factor [Methylomarinum sp. Ch1-1]|uniref:Response regulator transcription factor n=1 Tax=Methylomarinum roseum TaxID=3067653 RepID=A0AAU7NUV5_9GAMM|nr:response regulator transcription factor [Methylomarinum sp. Ch1-1]MDP4519087.1 response regulator transcription factor [Methylomarinum sp. Ch1-1]
MINVLIADDHALVREGLKQILSTIPDINVFREAANGDEAMKMIRENSWDILLLDISMPGKNVLELIKLAKNQAPHLPILVLSMYSEDQYAIRMLRAGADGYLCKESAPEQLVTAIRKLTQGGKYISPALSEKLVIELQPQSAISHHNLLTDREFQVFCAIACGQGITETADKMALSPKTVSTYRARILKKMQMKNNADLIRYAIANQLI